MSLDLTPDQQDQLQSLGISISKSTTNISEEIKGTQQLSPNIPQISTPPIPGTRTFRLLPLLSLSGLTIISFGGLLLFKSKTDTAIITPPAPIPNTESTQVPTQVPKSIQHYLLASQQLFTQALESQTDNTSDTVNLLNQSIITASDAIKTFPSDSRGYEQRGRIYQSLLDSQPQFLPAAISDLSQAAKLNPNSAEITRSLASLYARQGDAKNTLTYLAQTVNLEPTKAQNFYELARLQQQTGLLPQALETYDRLLTIISDPAQKTALETEKSALEKLVSQNSNPLASPKPTATGEGGLASPEPSSGGESPNFDSPLIQADAGNTGLIIAAPETSKELTVNNLTDSNALAGESVLPADTAQITLSNTNLTPESQVYLTVTEGGKNQVLQVLSRSTDSFTVGLDAQIHEQIKFKWWIVKP
jgi:tetratricopeptide (TPR) repeat protein